MRNENRSSNRAGCQAQATSMPPSPAVGPSVCVSVWEGVRALEVSMDVNTRRSRRSIPGPLVGNGPRRMAPGRAGRLMKR